VGKRAVVNFRPPYLLYRDEVVRAVTGVLDSGQVLQGEHVRHCERLLTGLTGKRHAVLFSSATTAIEALVAHDDAAVVTPTVNFVSLPYAARKFARPVHLMRRSRPLSGAMLGGPRGEGVRRWPVALAGQAGVDYERSVGAADIEDASQCFLTMTSRGMVGALGWAGVFSFTFNKAVTAGEGGCVVTDDDELADRLARYRDFGRSPSAAVPDRPIDRVGFNYRMSELHAAMLGVQLTHAHQIAAHMGRLWKQYEEALGEVGITPVSDAYDNYSRLIVRVPDGGSDVATVRRTLAVEHGIATPTPIMDYSLAESAGFAGDEEPGWNRLLCLPFWFGLDSADLVYVAEALAQVLAANA
jgi:dTDP-4-amino-4,6-dideoxygalactose transaminase